MLMDSHLGRGPAPYWRAVHGNIEPNASPWKAKVGLGRLLMRRQKSRFKWTTWQVINWLLISTPLKKKNAHQIGSRPPQFWEVKTFETFETRTYNNIANPVPFAPQKKLPREISCDMLLDFIWASWNCSAPTMRGWTLRFSPWQVRPYWMNCVQKHPLQNGLQNGGCNDGGGIHNWLVMFSGS